MNDDEATTLLDRLGTQVEVGSPPINNIFDDGDRIRRRRRLIQVAGIAAAIVVVSVGAYAVRPGASAPTATPPPPSATNGANVPVAPPGTRLVGKGGVVVAVPRSWTTNDIGCMGMAQSNTVLFNRRTNGGGLACSAGDPQASVLSIVDPSSSQLRGRVLEHDQRVMVDGLIGYRTLTACFNMPPDPSCGSALIFPKQQVSFEITSGDSTVVNEVLDSVQRLPKGFVNVPDLATMSAVEARQTLSSHGLAMTSPCEVVGCRSYVVTTTPAAGSPVAAGSTVMVAFYGGDTGGRTHGGATRGGAQIRGTLMISPPMSPPYATSGSIVMTGTHRLKFMVGDLGRFTVSVPPGRYTLVGHTPKFIVNGHQGDCITQTGAILIRPHDQVRVTVRCLEK